MAITREIFKYTGQDNLPPFWKPYFVNAELNKEYEVLLNSEAPIVEYHYNSKVEKDGKLVIVPVVELHKENLVMCNTPYEQYTNQPFFDLCATYNNPRVLSIGYGIGFIIDEMEKQNTDLTIVEKEQVVVDFETRDLSNHNIIVGDINTIDLSTLGTFDVIFCDITESITVRDELKDLLNEGGKIINWKHREMV